MNVMPDDKQEQKKHALWEYRVLHINVDTTGNSNKYDANQASEKLGGTLSPDFISKEFPDQYGESENGSIKTSHPASQMQEFLNIFGKEGWEMIEASVIGELTMIFFKRPLFPS